ncbi:FEKKY domain-containing protein [Chryseobacterium paridis]|uniref:Uncharacterized protein n=1 Tax=Chryseobacterium paridis TaxID=2800328 RepID=A0ABS1FWS7_9FLAO|nr:hypothetical protein [Chryseobacterium paridis]MBK1896901.1 hypothetical protein [Chryseobacterium paridis]
MAPTDGYYKILGYGYPNMSNVEGRNGIAEKWKIKYIDVAGCDVDQKLMDSVDIENKKTFVALDAKYGKDWKARYDKDVENFMLNKVEVMDVLITNKLFRKKLKDYNIEIDGVDKEVKELNDQGLYEVIVFNNNLQYENKECFRVQVDTRNRKVNLIK